MKLLILITVIIFFTNCKHDKSVWDLKTPMGTNRAFHSIAAINNKIYVFGGSTGKKSEFRDTSCSEMYDPQKNKWISRAPMPEPITTSCAIALDRKIYVIGGQQSIFSKRINKVLLYDPISNEWTYKSPMNIARAFHCVTALNNKIYAIGGRESDSEIKSKRRDSLAVYTIEEYNTNTDKWTIKKILPFRHFAIGAATINNKIYILSDTISNFTLGKSAIMEEYDPAKNSLKIIASMTPSRYDVAMTTANNKIYVFGGWNQGSLSLVEEYDPELDKWTNKSNFPFVIQNCQAISIRNRIFICGGIIYPGDGNEKLDFLIEYFSNRDKPN